VAVYLFSAIGVPVYLHYCGGELEEISYLVKSNGCCGEEESDETSDCCHNENVYIKNTNDFSLDILHIDFSKKTSQTLLFYATPTLSTKLLTLITQHNFIQNILFPPPKLCQQALLDCSVLKI